MGFILKKDEIKCIREALAHGEGRIPEMMQVLQKDVYEDIMSRSILDPVNGSHWLHCMQGRLSRAGFVHAFMPEPKLASWVHDSVMTVIRQPLDIWVGAAFRTRHNPPSGSLETSHLCVGIVHAVDMNTSLFSQEELTEIGQALRDKGLYLIKNWFKRFYQPGLPVHNWFTVLLAGQAVVAAFLDMEEEFEEILSMYDFLTNLFNKDSYGEPVGYWSYCAVHMVEIREYVARYKKELAESMDTSCYANCIPWAVASFLRTRKIPGWKDPVYSVCLNFGDSAYVRRFHERLLLSIATTEKNSNPNIAGLSRWLFDQQYQKGILSFEEKELGNHNPIEWWTPVLYATATEPISPQEAGLLPAMAFATGDVIIRDSWTDTKTVLAIRGGYESLNTFAHRHQDLNSFILSFGQEEFFIDPGHCCYRLDQYEVCKQTGAHNTVQLIKGEELLGQKIAKGCFNNREEPYSRKIDFRTENGVTIYSADAALAYGEIADKVIRTYTMVSENLILIRDDVVTKEPVKLLANFHINNFFNDLEYSLDKEKGVATLLRNQMGCKLVQLSCYADGAQANNILGNKWGVMHLNYHPYPNHKCQGLDGSALICQYKTEEEACRHTCLYAIIVDTKDNLDCWKIESHKEEVVIYNSQECWTVETKQWR